MAKRVRLFAAYILSDEGRLTAFMAPLSASVNKLHDYLKPNHRPSGNKDRTADGAANQRIHRSVKITTDRDAIFDVLTDVEKYKVWAGGCIETVKVIS